jgi:hypothetical protein
MVASNKFNFFIENLANKQIDILGTTAGANIDVFYAAITTDTPDGANDDELADLTEIGNSNGYTTGGKDIGLQATRTADVITITGIDVTWAATGGNLGGSSACRYFPIYDFTHANKKLMGWWDYGSTFTIAVGESITLDFGTKIADLGAT